jgi:hypothetical protein
MTDVPPRISAGLLAGLLLAAVALAGCQAIHSGGGETADRTALTAAELDLLTRSGSYVRNDQLLSRAEQGLIGECMTAKGFDYPVNRAAVPQPPSDDERIVNMADRQRNGYGLAQQDDPSAQSTSAAASPPPAGQDERYRTALDGSESELRKYRLPDGETITANPAGCLSAARAKLYGGDLMSWAQVEAVPQRLNVSLSKPLQADPALAVLMRQWSACMAESGYDYTNPDDAREKLAKEYEKTGATPEMRRRETTVAVTDGQCALRLRIPTKILDMRKRHAAALSAADKDRLRETTRTWLAAVETARGLTATG